MSSDEFAGYLTSNTKKGGNIYEEVIWPQIKKQIKASAQSVQDMVDNRKNSFEFYGYDFMVDQDMKVWLIEVNSSPSMSTKG